MPPHRWQFPHLGAVEQFAGSTKAKPPMFIAITYMKVRNYWRLPAFARHVAQIVRQSHNAPGRLYQSTTHKGLLRYYTLTAWESEAAMKKFRNSGAHLAAMKDLQRLSDDYGSTHFQAEAIPNWEQALTLLRENWAAEKT